MKAALSLCLLLLCSALLIGQDLLLTPIGETMCRPGVTNKSPSKGLVLEYGINPNVRFNSENTSALSVPTKVGVNRRYKMKIKVPILNKEKIKLLIGWNFYGEEYSFDQIGQENALIFNTIDDQHLKSSRLSLYMIRPINHQYYFAVKGVVSSNGDYNGMINFDERYTNFDIATIFGVKKRPDIEWGVGLLIRRNFLNAFPVVPFGIYNQTFNDKWGIQATIPTSLMGRYNFNDKNLILFGPQFESRNYSIDVLNDTTGDLDPYTMRRSDLRFSLRYDHNIKSWLWLEASTGYIRNFTTRFDDIQNTKNPEIVKVTPSNGPFFKFGLFLSPPKDSFR